MAYSELIKNINKVRDYMREFYVYGFKSREEYDKKSARSYDNERRRIESWLGDCMSFRRSAGEKAVFMSVDSRAILHNPLYKAYKAKSFTAGDVTFHFYLLDLLACGDSYSVSEITDLVSKRYLALFEKTEPLDESTIRKKLREYETLGLISSNKRGRENVYSLTRSEVKLEKWGDAVAFFSEEDPLGVIGSYILDKYKDMPKSFGFKHHYILHALDSEILCELLLAASEHRAVQLDVRVKSKIEKEHTHVVYPSKIFISTQNGRQYLLCYHYLYHRPMFFRLDNIISANQKTVENQYIKYEGYCKKFSENLWGVASGLEPSLDHIEMMVHIEDGEDYIVSRLEREKRCGLVKRIDDNTLLFSADVYDTTEMIPWLRTFIGRIVKLECTDRYVTDTFFSDLEEMRKVYGGETVVV